MAASGDNCELSNSSSEEEDLDPRIQEELECLNSASNEINTLETEVDNARIKFRSLLGESTQTLNGLFKKIGNCINKVRPYYELLKEARKAQAEAQRAVVNYQRAIGIYRAAMETVQLAETRAVDETVPKLEFDQAWQEVLNHATQRFMESEADKTKSEEEHMKRASDVARIQQQLKVMEKKWNRTIPKSRPYFELKERYELQLEQEKFNVEDLQRALCACKKRYKGALENLEKISNSVHEKRRKHITLPPRTPGVGAEASSSVCDLPSLNLDLISQCSDEAFEDFDDDMESVNSDTVSVCSEGKQSNDKTVKSHRRYKSCDVKSLITNANRTTSVDEGYSASTKSEDTSSESQSPELHPPSQQAVLPVLSISKDSFPQLTEEHTSTKQNTQTHAAPSGSQISSSGDVFDNLPKTAAVVNEAGKNGVIKQAASLNQDLSKLQVSEAQKQTEAESGNKKQFKDLSVVRKPAKLQTKAGLPLLDIASMSKDRALTF